jgi:hypothetical protein
VHIWLLGPPGARYGVQRSLWRMTDAMTDMTEGQLDLVITHLRSEVSRIKDSRAAAIGAQAAHVLDAAGEWLRRSRQT